MGALQGLNDPTTVTAFGTRWLATAGTILKYEQGKYGLLFSGGGCIDGDSDAFRYIGYAEPHDLLHWTVVNGLDKPILVTTPYTLTVDANGLPIFPPSIAAGTTITVPSSAAVGGVTSGFYSRARLCSGSIRENWNRFARKAYLCCHSYLSMTCRDSNRVLDR